MTKLTSLENAVLNMLLAGEGAALACLRAQLAGMHVTTREYSGMGFFTTFGHSSETVRLSNAKSMRFGDVLAELDGLEHGAGFLLFVDDGLVTMLEGYSYAEPWPEAATASFTLRYQSPTRDLSIFESSAQEPATG